MTESEYLEATNILYERYVKSDGEAGFGSFSERLAWLVIEYKEGSQSKVAGWWNEDFD